MLPYAHNLKRSFNLTFRFSVTGSQRYGPRPEEPSMSLGRVIMACPRDVCYGLAAVLIPISEVNTRCFMLYRSSTHSS
jgi:hypothetical protein